MSTTPNIPALVPEVLKASIPDDTSLATQCPVWIDFEGMESIFVGVSGKELAQGGGMGSAALASLTALDTQVKGFIPAFEDWYETTDMGALERWGERAKKRRLEVTNRAEAIRKSYKIVAGDFDVEHDRLAAIEQVRLEEIQRQEALADKQRQIDAARAAADAAQTAAEKAEHEAQATEIATAPIVPVAVSKHQAIVSKGLAEKPAGTTSTPVCWRKVRSLQELFAYLGSEQGKGLIGSLCRVKSADRTSDEITISFTSLKKDFSNDLGSGVNLHRGSEGSNRGK